MQALKQNKIQLAVENPAYQLISQQVEAGQLLVFPKYLLLDVLIIHHPIRIQRLETSGGLEEVEQVVSREEPVAELVFRWE